MIRGNLVALGPLMPGDFEALFRWANDVEAARLNETYRPLDWQTQHEFWANIGKSPSTVVFAIRRLDGVPHLAPIIGYVQITNIDAVHRSAMIGIRIGDGANRGRGFGRDALALARDYCWKQLNLSRLALSVFDNNPRAIDLYRSLGFRKEGVLRRAVFIDGRWVDVVLMAALQSSRQNRRPAGRQGPD